MAENVIAAVIGKKELIEGAAVPLAVAREIERSAIPALYIDTGKIARQIVDRLIALAKRDALPQAEAAGQAGAAPILEALGATKLTTAGLRARGDILRWLQRRENLSLKVLRTRLENEAGYLSGEIRAMFTEAERGGEPRKALIEKMVAADKAELAGQAQGEKRILDAQADAGEARDLLRKNPDDTAAQEKLALAEEEVAKAKKALPRRVGFLARLESKAQGHFRDAIRRVAEDTQQATFAARGYKMMCWIAVNGTDACPDCEARHGREQDMNKWLGDAPGDGGTVCKSACMCHLIPSEYAAKSTSLTKPLTLKAGPSGRPPGKRLES